MAALVTLIYSNVGNNRDLTIQSHLRQLVLLLTLSFQPSSASAIVFTHLWPACVRACLRVCVCGTS